MYSEYDESDKRNAIEDALRPFNWGAFGFGIFWAIFNGALKEYSFYFILTIIFALMCKYVPIIGIYFVVPIVLIALYVGHKGNEWAWNGFVKWRSIYLFNKDQKRWAVAFGVIYSALLIVAILFSGYILGVSKSNGGLETFTNKMIIRDVLSNPLVGKAETGADLASLFAQRAKLSLYDKDSVLVKSEKNDKEFVVKFYKKGACDLEQANCYVIYYDKTETGLESKIKTYFDEKGKTRTVYLDK